MRRIIHLVPMFTVVLLLAIVGTGCTAKVKESYHLRRAESYFAAGQYDQAAIEYKNVLRNNQQNAQAWSRLGIIYFGQGRLMEAAQILSRAQQLAATNLDVRMKLGTIYLGAGQLKEARDEASLVLDKNPGDPQAPILLAETATTNQVAETRRLLQKMSQPGETAPLATALGVLSFRAGELKAAETEFKRAVALDPKFSEAWSALGNLYMAQKELKLADQAFKSAADLAPPRSGKVLQYAQFKMLTGDAAAGKQLLTDFVKTTPDYVPAWIALAQIAAAEKKYAEGVALLGNVLSRDPQNLEGLLLKGRLELQQGETAQAIKLFEGASKMFAKAPLVHYQLAQARLANHETDQAVASLNQALALNPNYADAILALGEIQIRNGNVPPAITSLKRLIEKQPQIISAQLLLAEAYRAQGSLDSAVQIYRSLANIYPQNPQLPLLLGTTLLQQRKNAEARLEFGQALKLSPDYYPALEQMVDLDLKEKQFEAAQQRVQQQIAQHPQAAVLQQLLAGVLVARGDTNQAERTLLKTIELEPDSPQARMLLAQFYAGTGQNQKALAALHAMLASSPKNPGALMLMGMTYEAQKNYQDASDTYEKLLAIVPNHSMALNNLACLSAEHLGQLDKAYQLAHQARNLAPAEPSIADTLGWILYQKAEYASALQLLRESAAKMNAVPEIQYHLGMTYYMMGDEANARTALQRAVLLDQDLPEKSECDQSLAVLAIDTKTAGADQRAWLEKRVASQTHDPVALMRLAAIDERAGLVDRAMAAYEAALKITPQNVPALVNLARLQTPQNPQMAFTLAKAAYKLAPNDPLVTHTLGRLAFLTGDFPWSLSLLQLTAQMQPQNAELLYDLAEAFYSVGRVSEARTAMQSALQTGAAFSRTDEAGRFLAMTALADEPAQALAAQSQVETILKATPDDVPALMARAVIVGQKSDFTAAAQTYEAVLKHYPDFSPAQKQLAMLYAKSPDTNDKANALAVKARKALPADPEVAKTLGITVYRQGDFARAAGLLQESARQRTQDAELMYFLGMAQYQLKNRTESKAALRRALDLNLSGIPAAEAKKILAELK